MPLVGYCSCRCAALALLLLLLVLLAADPAAAFRPTAGLPISQQRRSTSSSSSSTAIKPRMQMQADGAGGEEPLLSPLLGAVATSKTIEIHAMTKAMEARGEEVVSLCVGEPDFPPPPGALIGLVVMGWADCNWVVCGFVESLLIDPTTPGLHTRAHEQR